MTQLTFGCFSLQFPLSLKAIIDIKNSLFSMYIKIAWNIVNI